MLSTIFFIFLVWQSFDSKQRVLLLHLINILYNMIEILEYIDFTSNQRVFIIQRQI